MHSAWLHKVLPAVAVLAMVIGLAAISGCDKSSSSKEGQGQQGQQGQEGVITASGGQPTKPKAEPEPNPADLSTGTTTLGEGKPSDDKAAWPQFRGANRDGIAADAKGLLRTWPADGPKTLWSIDLLGEGYAGPAVCAGKVYFEDYDKPNSLWMMRCVSLADGKEIWRWSYRRLITPNHAITRAVPAVDEKYVVQVDPMCVLHGFDAATGKRLWAHDLTTEFRTVIPQWYSGQCPLIDGDRVIVGIGGKDVLLAAFDKATGKVLWTTPNTDKRRLSHSSVMPMTLCGRKQFVWCTMPGPGNPVGAVVGVDAADGSPLWSGPADAAGKVDWKPSTAVGPSMVPVPGDRVFVTSGYNVGSVMMKIEQADGKFVAKSLVKLKDTEFASGCHTPIVWSDHLFAVNEEGAAFTCVDFDGKVDWESPAAAVKEPRKGFELGCFILADGMFYIVEGTSGRLHLVEASASGWKELAVADGLLAGGEVWAPMALVNGKLLCRDLKKLLCLQVGAADK